MILEHESPHKQVLLAIFIVLILGGIAYLFFQPAPQDVAGWRTFTDEARGISFQYPEELDATYIEATDWPPQVQILQEPFSCTEAGAENEAGGRTEERRVSTRTYCVTARTEGAAGSIYSLYAYAFPVEEETAMLTFGTRSTQCGNYPEAEMAACEAERESFDLDALADRIARTLTVQ